MKCETLKVKPWGKGQGDFVEINREDYDPARHELYGEVGELDAGESEFDSMTNAQLRDHLTLNNIKFPPNANKAALLALCGGGNE